VFILNMLVMFLNYYPMTWKHQIVHSAADEDVMKDPKMGHYLINLSGVTQQVYRQLSAQENGIATDEEAARGYIVVENEVCSQCGSLARALLPTLSTGTHSAIESSTQS
jgi:hypothetical protein